MTKEEAKELLQKLHEDWPQTKSLLENLSEEDRVDLDRYLFDLMDSAMRKMQEKVMDQPPK